MPNAEAGAPSIVAVLDDLLFTVKINEAAKRLSLPVRFVKSEADALHYAAATPRAILVDLHCGSVDPLRLIQALKTDAATRSIPLIGYVSHVDGELKQRAQQAGCDLVLARSAFSRNLQEILARYSS